MYESAVVDDMIMMYKLPMLLKPCSRTILVMVKVTKSV